MALPDVDHHRERRRTVTGPHLCGMWDDTKDGDVCNDPAPTAYVVHVFPAGMRGEARVESVLLLCDRHRDAMLNA